MHGGRLDPDAHRGRLRTDPKAHFRRETPASNSRRVHPGGFPYRQAPYDVARVSVGPVRPANRLWQFSRRLAAMARTSSRLDHVEMTDVSVLDGPSGDGRH